MEWEILTNYLIKIALLDWFQLLYKNIKKHH